MSQQNPHFARHQHYERRCRVCRQAVDDVFGRHFGRHFVPNDRSDSHSVAFSCLRFVVLFFCAALLVLSVSALFLTSGLFPPPLPLWPALPPPLALALSAVCALSSLLFLFGFFSALFASVSALRVFGFLLSYLLVLSSAAFLYGVSYLLLTRSQTALPLAGIAAGALLVHSCLAIAPFALADLCVHRRNEALVQKSHQKSEKSARFVRFHDI